MNAKMELDRLVFAFADKGDGTYALMVGLTADGLSLIARESGTCVRFDVPEGLRAVSEVVLFADETAAEVRERMRQACPGTPRVS